MFSNYLQKIFSPNSPNHKDNEAKLQIYSSNTLRSKRVSTNQQKPNQQISLENDQNSNTLHTYEPLYSTKKKTGNECNTLSYSTNTFTATKPSHRYEYGNVGELNNNHINSNNNEVNRAKDVEVNTYTPKYRDNYNSNGNGINSINSMNTNSANGNMRISEQIKMLNGVRSNSSSGIRKCKYFNIYIMFNPSK